MRRTGPNNGKNGAPFGERHGKAQLTDEQVRAMRAKYKPWVYGYRKLAAEFGCGMATARDICNYFTRMTA